MRHRKSGVKLNRTSSHRDAMFRNMVTSLFKYERIRTTDAKAKELRRWADHLVTLAKRGDLHARRQAMAIIREKDVVHKLFEEAQDKFGKRKGGYTRVIKIGRRPGDAAKLSMIELVLEEAAAKKKKPAPKPKAAAAPAPATAPVDDAAEKEVEASAAETTDGEAEAEAVETSAEEAQAAPEAEVTGAEDSAPAESAAAAPDEAAASDEAAAEEATASDEADTPEADAAEAETDKKEE